MPVPVEGRVLVQLDPENAATDASSVLSGVGILSPEASEGEVGEVESEPGKPQSESEAEKMDDEAVPYPLPSTEVCPLAPEFRFLANTYEDRCHHSRSMEWDALRATHGAARPGMPCMRVQYSDIARRPDVCPLRRYSSPDPRAWLLGG